MARSGETAGVLAPNGWPQELLDGFRAGRRDALATVYELHAPGVAALLRHGFSFRAGEQMRRFAGYTSPFDLQDALHSTFLAAFEERARLSYDGIRPYGPYLRTIARNLTLKHFRSREELFPSGGSESTGDPVAGVPDSTPSPEQQAADHQMRRRVEQFLSQLSPADRELLQVRFVDQVPQRQAAERLGLTRQRLRTREARLRARMLRYVRGHDRDPGLGALSLLLLLRVAP